MNHPAAIRHNLPAQPTPFVGRARELEQLARLLSDPNMRLVTILAPGGMGKTRLALEAARQELPHFADGVFFIPFAPLSSTDDIVTTIAEYVGFNFYSTEAPRQQVLDYFRERHALLVLDNCEHLLTDISLLAELIQAAPNLKILATSREKLNLSAETIFTLGGMSFPLQKASSDALEYDAVRLFVQSARRVRPDFDLSPDSLTHIINICRLTEGMPLGIVLAAGWLDTLGLWQIATEIQQGIDILETDLRDVLERQRSVRATLNYSWERLAEAERDILMKLSVFRGGFTAEAAGFVAGAHRRLLRKLADKALIQVNAGGRYAIHELLRQFGEEKLNDAGIGNLFCQKHCTYFADFMRQREADVKGRRQLEALNEIETDFNNIRTAWAWAVQCHNHADLDAMLETLHLFCDLRARYQEGTVLFEQAMLAMNSDSGEAPRPVCYRLQARQAAMWLLQERNSEDAHSQLLICEQVAKASADHHELAYCVFQLGEVAKLTENHLEALQYQTKSHSLFHILQDDYYVERALRALALTYFHMGGKYREQQASLSHEFIDLAREIGDYTGMAHGIFYLGFAYLYQAKFAEGVSLLEEARKIWDEMGDRKSAAIAAVALSFYWFAIGEIEQAEAQAKENLAIGADVNSPSLHFHGLAMLSRITAIREDYETAHDLAKSTLGKGIFGGPWEMAMAEVGLMNFYSAQHFLSEALQYALHLGDRLILTNSLPLSATILAHNAHYERGVELLGLAFNQPRALMGWMEKWPLLTRLCDELEAKLGTEAYAAAWAHGSAMDLESVCRDALADLHPGNSSMVSSHRHPDTLTARELEVLRLLARGHSNREIAEVLVLSIGTVKGYVYNVCQKLGAQNRTQAAARARELNLV